ncbi:Down-regulator of transcription 1 [Xylographa parallela]|nr:Down-regulator of transcription 1 [Xylographa parallela]
MSDREFGGNDDLTLPKVWHGRRHIPYKICVERHLKFHTAELTENVGSHVTATIQKIITEILGDKSGLTFGKEARDLLIDCSVEFITLISSEANEIAEKESKKTIAAEHIDKALRELGFPEYVSETREKKTNKLQDSGLTDEQLLQQQQELFRSATEKYNSGPA